MTVDDQVRQLLLGTTVRTVRRSVDMGDIEFIGPRDEPITALV